MPGFLIMLMTILMPGILLFAAPGETEAKQSQLTGIMESAVISSADPTKIDLRLRLDGLDREDPPEIFIFEVKPYEGDIQGRKDYLTSAFPDRDILLFHLDLYSAPGDLRIYDAFVAAVEDGQGGFRVISNRCHIQNPEAIAPVRTPELNRGKKGIMVDPNLIDDALELNIKHAQITITTSQLFGEGITYTYEGREYHFSKVLVADLDRQIIRLSDAGVAVTAVLVNGWNPTEPALYRPGTSIQRADQALYYGFNVETEDGFHTVKAIASFLANRYCGRNGHGKITNWVIGNEINNQYWNYVGEYDVSLYTLIFQRTFRVFYTAIRSISANDNVMFSLDYYWTMPPEAGSVGKYPGKDVLDWFVRLDQLEGKTDWGLALHPYPYPLQDPVFWDDYRSGKVTDRVDTPVVSIKNLAVMTDYMHRSELLNRDDQVRPIFLTEQGFNSAFRKRDTTGYQAAGLVYGYYIAENLPEIKAFILSRQLDNEAELEQGLAYGLSYADGKTGAIIHKPAWGIYKVLDDPAGTEEASEFALKLLGIRQWDSVIGSFHYPGRR